MNFKNEDLQKYWIKDMKLGWNKSSGSREGFKFFCQAANFTEGGAILDAGAGNLRFKPLFEKSIYLSQEHSAGIEFKGMRDIEYDLINPIDQRIPLKGNALDGIISNSVIEHIRYPERFFAEAYRVLKPGGRIYISVPFFAFEHEVPYDFQRPTRFGLQRWLEDAGFNQIKVTPSSTCTANIVQFLPVAVVYDLLRTNKNPKKWLLKIFRSKGYLGTYKVLPLFFLAGFGYFTMKLLAQLLNFIVNVQPYPDANMPSGWLALASKPGKYIKIKYKSKAEFLRKYKEVEA